MQTLRVSPLSIVTTLLVSAGVIAAATPDRIPGAIDVTRFRALSGNVHRLAQPQYDQGEAGPDLRIDSMMLLLKPSPAQLADLAKLVADQQDPASPHYHQWLTPDQFGERFGLSQSDLSKLTGWLKSEGFTIDREIRGRNWVAFSGTARQVESALHTKIHRYAVNGETHFANVSSPSIPEALAAVAGEFVGLNDFHAQPMYHNAQPLYESYGSHFLAPADFSTIYDLGPLQQAGLDGTGQSLAIVGESDFLLSDLSTFRSRYGLPAKAPVLVPYSTDPGYNGAEVEAVLDLEWAGAIAPKATIYYVYGTNAFSAMAYAIEIGVAPVISVSYSGCEMAYSVLWQVLIQEANAEGMTILAASGDSGPAGCDGQGYLPVANLGRTVSFPSALPEVTGVGGTQFAEGTGTYWNATNAPSTQASALSYIPEAAWNETDGNGLGASGGGASRIYSKPGWQTGPGVPNDGARDVPDVSLSAASHDGYQIVYGGQNYSVAGTSCGTPSMAGIVTLLNQYQVQQGKQSTPGLGNINPQLYRLSQAAPIAFHDVVSGGNVVPCGLGSTDCTTGSFGYPAGPGYDQATGLGSIDAAMLFQKWNSEAQAAAVTLTASVAKATVNDTVTLTATVAAATGSAVPTGSVSFSVYAGAPLGTAPLTATSGKQTATVTVPTYLLGGTGTFTLFAVYSGDATFGTAGGLARLQVTAPTGGAAAVLATGPSVVSGNVDLDSNGPSWVAALTLREIAGVAAMVTGFTIDGQAQSVATYFPSPDIKPNGSLSAQVTLRNQATPLVHTFGFTGVDLAGNSWSRSVAVTYVTLPDNNYSFTVTPNTVMENDANPSCPFALQVNLNNESGYMGAFSSLYEGTAPVSSLFVPTFGTARLQSWGSLQGTLCLTGMAPPAVEYVYAVNTNGFAQQTQVNFVKAVANQGTLSASPAAVALSAADASSAPTATIAINLSDKTQPWTATVYPLNRTSGWLSASQLSGPGPGTITLTAPGFGFAPGAYRGLVTVQSPNSIPQFVTVPVMFVLGASSTTTIASVANPASSQATVAPGMLLSVFGTGLSPVTQVTTSDPLPFTSNSVTATVNGYAAPLLYISPTQVNIQVPYEVGAGPAVIGINNNGKVAGFPVQVTPSAPAIYTDGSGNLSGNPTVAPGGLATLYLNGTGDVTSALLTGQYSPASPALTPFLPISVTVGGVPALLQYASLAPLNIATAQINFYVPSSLKPGPQPVVVTVGGASSPAVNIAVGGQ